MQLADGSRIPTAETTPSVAAESCPSEHSRRCVLCGNDEPDTLFELYRPILRCDKCGLVYAEPVKGGAAPGDYTEDYYRSGVYADYLKDRPAVHKNASRALAQIESLVEGRDIFDVGCAAGFFLEAARARGWAARGIEFSEYASEYARRELKLPVVTGSIVTPPPDLPRSHVVTLWDTIEHLDKPDVALANIRRLLHPQGLFVFSTGDYDSLLRRLTGRNWRLFSDPTHNFFFDEQTLRRLLHQTGYEVLRTSRRGKWVSLAMILHQSGLPMAHSVGRLVNQKNFNPPVYVNLRDVITIIARPTREFNEDA